MRLHLDIFTKSIKKDRLSISAYSSSPLGLYQYLLSGNWDFDRYSTTRENFHQEEGLDDIDSTTRENLKRDIIQAISDALMEIHGSSDLDLIKTKELLSFECPFSDRLLYECIIRNLLKLPWVDWDRGQGGNFSYVRSELGVEFALVRISPRIAINSECVGYSGISGEILWNTNTWVYSIL